MSHVIFNSIWVGVLAGILGGAARLGWSATLPVHSLQVHEQSPIANFLAIFGFSKRTINRRLSLAGGQGMPLLQSLTYYVYSIIVAVIFVFGANADGNLTHGLGTMYGLIIWIVVDLIFLPLFQVVPVFWRRSLPELAVEMSGYLFFGWAVYLVAVGLPVSVIYF
ncbi:DUF1440 domain-containing protein [Fructobacillus ficulneus]|uniref:Integral membrane protein n=1 Tax=Fructobacillus ficulneus TaxID=157463 RepID=A0A0K8MG33_9LACO|nr:DUF1440 domain-containing protein [Fructobacillus ficulneus]GAO99455.1 hypothetical protein FFIC_140490 [Fructobacillus ficulneus]